MKTAAIPEIKKDVSVMLDSNEPLLITRQGNLSGLYLPLEYPDRIPSGVSRRLASVLGGYLAQLLQAQGISDGDIEEDFRDFRRNRC